MTANPRQAGLALLVTIALSSTLTACAATTAEPVTEQRSPRAALAYQLVDAGAPGVIVRVDNGHGHTVEFARQAPWTRPDHRLTPRDEFRMGSNTKTMVATVILQLVAEHRLRLTDPASRWLPGLIPNGSAITLRTLLNHTSGLFNYTFDPDVLKAFTGQDTTVWTPPQLIAAAVRHAPLFAPGTSYSYSNTNYVALGLIAEHATGQILGDLIH